MTLIFVRFDTKEQLLTFIVDGIFVLIFVIALIFHSHQTEATYRLDFIWKLQATGKFILHPLEFLDNKFYLFPSYRGKGRYGTSASIQ